MRSILRKLERRQKLEEQEYKDLLTYAQMLRVTAPDSYLLFYDRYANYLLKDYTTYLPRFAKGQDDLINFLLSRPDLIETLRNEPLSVNNFPHEFHPYLRYTFADNLITRSDLPVIDYLLEHRAHLDHLPRPRTADIVYKYEEANPYKEPGLKTHFEKVGRYAFITRLISYRYLTRNKAHSDSISVVGKDCLRGIFTNKEKSIYYYIYLTEDDEVKSRNACQILNLALGYR